MCNCEYCCQFEDHEEEGWDEDHDDEREEYRIADCRCGAYVWLNGRYVQIADCVC